MNIFISKNSIKKLIIKLKTNKIIASVGGIQKPKNLNNNDWYQSVLLTEGSHEYSISNYKSVVYPYHNVTK